MAGNAVHNLTNQSFGAVMLLKETAKRKCKILRRKILHYFLDISLLKKTLTSGHVITLIPKEVLFVYFA